MPEHEEEQFLDASQAAQYLATRWGLSSYSVEAFKMLRHRWNIQPVIVTKNASLWRKVDLDKIEKPDRGRARGKRTKKDDDSEGFPSSVILMLQTPACLVEAAAC